MYETETKPLHLCGGRPRPRKLTASAERRSDGAWKRVVASGEELEPDAVFIERDGSEHPAWLLREYVSIVLVLDDPSRAGDYNAPTRPEMRFGADLIVAFQHPEHGPGVESVLDLQAVPHDLVPEHKVASRTYRRKDGKRVATWDYKLVTADTPDPKTGAARTCKPGTWTVEYVGSKPAPAPKNGARALTARKPLEIEKHEALKPDPWMQAITQRSTRE